MWRSDLAPLCKDQPDQLVIENKTKKKKEAKNEYFMSCSQIYMLSEAAFMITPTDALFDLFIYLFFTFNNFLWCPWR